MEIREYTRDEFNKFIEQNNLESFNSNQVDAFSHDVVEKSKKGELNEFETYCAAAEYAMLEKAIVVENDLTKSPVYYRPTQVETVEIPDGIFKSINDKSSLRYKETSLNILKGIAGINCADEDAIEKAKALPIGTEKTYGGKLYIKTAQGWRLKKKEVTPRERFEKEKNERYSKMDKRSFEIADKIAKEILDEGLVDEDTNELTMSHVIGPKIDKMINEQTKDWGVKASELKPGEVVHINEFPTSVKLTYKGEENGKYIFERENGEVEKVRSKSRVFHRDDQLIDKTAVAWKVRDILNKKRTGWFGKSENVEFEKEC